MFQEKVVVITGAGRGIGRTLALGFAAQGATIGIHYAHAEQGAQEVQRQIEELGQRAVLFRADLAQPEQVEHLISKVHTALGTIDVWVNNAGASANSLETRGMSEIDIFEQLMHVDVMGTWLCSRRIAPYMRDGGCILTLAWDGALANITGATGLQGQLYAMSKGAILSLTRCLAAEFAPRVRVNCLALGHIENAWSQRLARSARERIEHAIPLQRWGTAQDVLDAALFLASPTASFITGQVLVVNGGEVMR
jgi:3-oxoacyl-[acyl-carrier protein] reductase